MIDADNTVQASSKLKSRGLFPYELIQEGDSGIGGTKKRPQRTGRIRKSEITAFSRQLATLINSGTPIVESLTALSEQAESSHLKRIIVDIKEKVSTGMSFSESLSHYPRYFSPVYVNLVKAGETGGNLDSVMEELAELGEKQEAVKGKVMAAMAYPVFMTVVGLIVMIILFVLVVPKIISIFDNMGQALPLPTRLLIFTTNFLQGYWIHLLLLTTFLFIFLLRGYKTTKGKSYIDRFLLRVPVTGKIICKLDVSRFSRTLSLLLSGGVPVTEALNIVKDVVKNSAISDNIERAKNNLAEGGDLHSPLKEAGIFPPVAVHMIAVGERGGKLEDMLLNIANSFDRDIESFAAGMTSVIEPLLIVVMGLIVGFIALAILLPIFEMNMLVG